MYDQIINRLTDQSLSNYCHDGQVEWEKLLRFNSGSAKKENEHGN
jgi:hypothetical protein